MSLLMHNEGTNEVTNPGITTSLGEYIKLTLLQPAPDGLCLDYGSMVPKKTVYIYPNKVYSIRYYDPDDNTLKTARGMVKSISQHYLVMNTIGVNIIPQCKICPSYPMHDGINFISSTNLIITYSTITDIVSCDYCTRKGEIVFLGITAEAVKAIVVRIGIVDDNTTIAYVDMKIDDTYHVTYMDGCSICEVIGKLVAIEEQQNTNVNDVTNDCLVRQPDQTGMFDNAYKPSNGFLGSKEPVTSDILFTFDPTTVIGTGTSTDIGSDDAKVTLKLSSIRACELIEAVPVPPAPQQFDFTVIVGTDEFHVTGTADSLHFSSETSPVEGTVSIDDLMQDHIEDAVNGGIEEDTIFATVTTAQSIYTISGNSDDINIFSSTTDTNVNTNIESLAYEYIINQIEN